MESRSMGIRLELTATLRSMKTTNLGKKHRLKLESLESLGSQNSTCCAAAFNKVAVSTKWDPGPWGGRGAVRASGLHLLGQAGAAKALASMNADRLSPRPAS